MKKQLFSVIVEFPDNSYASSKGTVEKFIGKYLVRAKSPKKVKKQMNSIFPIHVNHKVISITKLPRETNTPKTEIYKIGTHHFSSGNGDIING